jgi:aminopeptidase C
MMSNHDHKSQARAYLTEQLADDAPSELVPVAQFSESPLEGEGAATVFQFTASLQGNPPETFYVVAGETEPNYYPAWDLSADEIYSVHVATRFMLVLEVQSEPVENLPDDTRHSVEQALQQVVPGEAISHFEPQLAFRVEQDLHAVSRIRIANEDVYVVSGNLPLGIYRQVDRPPHVIYRLHLGTIIRSEEEPTDEDN